MGRNYNTNYNTTIWLFWVTIDCANDKTKQPVVLLCVAATIRVATVLHRNNVECSSPRNKEYNLHVPWVPHTEVPQTHVDYEYALQNLRSNL